jgi:hypothetical protein
MHTPSHRPKPISLIDLITTNKTDEARRLIVKYGQYPAKNMTELKMRLAYVMKKFPKEVGKDIAAIHPHKFLFDSSSFTGAKLNDGYSYNNACGCNGYSCDGKCECKKNKKEEHSNIVTNYRSDVDSPAESGLHEMNHADGGRLRTVSREKQIGGIVLLATAIIIIGAIATRRGEQYRAY